MKTSSFFLVLAPLCAAPAFAAVTVSGPTANSTVGTPFVLTAAANSCSGQPLSAMGYSLDSGPTIVIKSASINAQVTASTGAHILHVKSWGSNGASCTTSVAISVQSQAPAKTTNVTVSAPLNGASVTSPFAVAGAGTLCSGQAITAMGYSLDNSASTSLSHSTSFSGSVTANAGAHTLHVKSWGKNGASCITNIGVTVTAPHSVITSPTIPPNATATKDVQNIHSWTAEFDARTSGSASGATTLVTAPAVSGSARQFATSYTNYGGERYNVDLNVDQVSTNFVYDTQIYVASPSTDVSNIEIDLNQVISNGQTVIFGFQCDGWSKTWDYAENAGTPTTPKAHWLHSNQSCTPQNWSPDAWHHVQIQYSRDSSGNVTYQAVWLDGIEQDLNVTVNSAFALGWGKSLNLNFQVDGMTSTSGTSTLYLDNSTLYSW